VTKKDQYALALLALLGVLVVLAVSGGGKRKRGSGAGAGSRLGGTLSKLNDDAIRRAAAQAGVPPEAINAYLSLPPAERALLGDPVGGALGFASEGKNPKEAVREIASKLGVRV
jgi:hypothetical protein